MNYDRKHFFQDYGELISLPGNEISVCNYIDEKEQLTHFCQQILQNFKPTTIEDEPNIEILDYPTALTATSSIVDHLSESDLEVIHFDIDLMIELNIYKVISMFICVKSSFASKFPLQEEDLILLLQFSHLTLIWSNGTKEQNHFLFEPQFYQSILELSRIYFYQNSDLIHFLIQSITNLLILKYPEGDDIHEITQRLLMLPNDQSSFHTWHISIFKPMKEIIQCFHLIVRNYFKNEEYYNETEMNGIIVTVYRWIEKISTNYLEADDQEAIDSLCSALCCANEIVKFKPDTTSNFYTKEFVTEYLLQYLHSFDLHLKMCSIETLKYILTIQNEFDGWMLMNPHLWRAFEEVTDYEIDSNVSDQKAIEKSDLDPSSNKPISSFVLKECFIESVLYIIQNLPETPIKNSFKTNQFKINNPFQFVIKNPFETKNSNQMESENQSELNKTDLNQNIELNEIEDKKESHQINQSEEIDENHGELNEPHQLEGDFNQSEGELNESHQTEGELNQLEFDESNDSDYDDNFEQDIVYEKNYSCIIQLYEEGILTRLIELTDLNESFRVRSKSMVAIANVIQYCTNTEIDHFIFNNCISIFLNSLELFDKNDAEIILNGLITILNHIERNPSGPAIQKCIDDLMKNDAENQLENLNSLHDNELNELIEICIEKLKMVLKNVKYRSKKTDEENEEFLREYEEDE